jgi:hypothetical protein
MSTRLNFKRLPTPPPLAPDGTFVEDAQAKQGAGGALLLALVKHADLTREAAGSALGVTAACVTNWIHGVRPLTIQRMAQAAGWCGFQLRLIAVPVGEDGEPLPTQADEDAITVARLRTILDENAPADGEAPSELWVELRDVVEPETAARTRASAGA